MYEGSWNPAKGRSGDEKNPADMLDKKTMDRLVGDLRSQLPPGGFQKHKPVVEYKGKGPPGIMRKNPKPGKPDQDLLSTMAMRLTKLESLTEMQRKELKDKTERMREMRDEIEDLQLVASKDFHKKYEELKKDKQLLETECMDMKDFLKEYGLIWRGKGKTDGNFDGDRLKEDMDVQGPMYRNNLPTEIDLNIIGRRIQELNFIAEKDSKQVINEKGVHKLIRPDPVQIGFFMDGLILRGFPFRAYHSKQAQSILSDILEGYFPFDLKHKFPDGVELQIIDHTEENYSEVSKIKARVKDIKALAEEKLYPMSKEDFLKGFPENRMVGGKVVPIRSEIAAKLGGGAKAGIKLQPNETVEVKTQVVIDLESGKVIDPKEIVILRVRTESGNNNIIIKLMVSDKMSALYEITNQYAESANYEIMCNFPRKNFLASEQLSLKELGLAPSSALVMHKMD